MAKYDKYYAALDKFYSALIPLLSNGNTSIE